LGTILLGDGPAMRAVHEQLRAVAGVPWAVRIEGERGTGKNVAAQLLHRVSGRSGSFVKCGLNVVSANEGREVAELVGWARGAFTGAVRGQAGVFEDAHGGTAFLNEMGLASRRVQEVLLELLEDQVVRRLGERRSRPVNVRVICATNTDLEAAVQAGTFREDLYDRLGVLVIRMPALREHLEDLPELASAILTRKAEQAGVRPPDLQPRDLNRFLSYEWPGNVRELEKALEHYVTFRRLPAFFPSPKRQVRSWHVLVQQYLAQCDGNKSAAARALGVTRQGLIKYLRQRPA
jgi:DNA-binding NtrC family response regulator